MKKEARVTFLFIYLDIQLFLPYFLEGKNRTDLQTKFFASVSLSIAPCTLRIATIFARMNPW